MRIVYIAMKETPGDRTEASAEPLELIAAPHSDAQFITVATAAKILDTTESALRAKIKRHEFPNYVLLRYGKRALRFDLIKLTAYLRSGPPRPRQDSEACIDNV